MASTFVIYFQHYASRWGRGDVVEFLLGSGAEVNVQTRSSLATPLHRAVYCGQVNVVRLLLEAGAQTQLTDTDGSSAFHKV